jgi:glycosyltransferase involved in cell wall biosynthesis
MLKAQTFKDWEAILVDDGSQDGTVSIIQSQSAKDPRFRLITKNPEGYPSRSRACGLNAARGPYVAFCDHDDFWAPQKLEMQLQVLRQHPDLAILHTDRIVWKQQEPPETLFYFDRPLEEIPVEKQDPKKVIYGGLRIIFSSFIAKKDLVTQVGFHPEMKGVDDFYLFLRLAQLGSIYHIRLPLTYYYAHQSNLSFSNNIFVDGFYKVYEVLKEDDVPDFVKRSVFAQACRTEGVSLMASDRRQAHRLLWKSLRSYFIPTTLNRIVFLWTTFLVPPSAQRVLMDKVKRLKFLFPNLKDFLSQVKNLSFKPFYLAFSHDVYGALRGVRNLLKYDFKNDQVGYCNICGRYAAFRYRQIFTADHPMIQAYDHPVVLCRKINTLNSLDCSWCLSKFRVRAAASVILDKYFSGRLLSVKSLVQKMRLRNPETLVLETASSGGIFSDFHRVPGLVKSEYFSDVPRGSFRQGVRSEDLEKLTFPDAAFDLVISLDVFEHLIRPWDAFGEVLRVLKPKGMAIITFPMDEQIPLTRTRAVVDQGIMTHRLSEVYHLDPLSEKGVLVVTDFGMDIVALLKQKGIKATLEGFTTQKAGFDQFVLVLTKEQA